ncbi:MAG TPA: ATP-binding protein, partial [Nitrospiria bacterium]
PKQSGESFFPDDISLLELISRQAGVALENARLYRMLERQMEELKRSQTQQLLQSAKLASIGELATNVAHEINNPLTSILGFTTLILDGMEESDPNKRDLKVIESEAIRSRDIVRNLLDFARKRPVRRELTDINQTIEKTLNLLRHQAELSNIELREEYDTEIPTITVDADQMKQVFINLLKNAFDAMPNGGILTITTHLNDPGRETLSGSISVKEIPLSGPNIEIRFKDSGVGISKEGIKKIFDPFFSTKEEMGTGLGLAVSYGIIERHSGRLDVYSEIGQGSTFVIRLPVKQESRIPS